MTVFYGIWIVIGVVEDAAISLSALPVAAAIGASVYLYTSASEKASGIRSPPVTETNTSTLKRREVYVVTVKTVL